MTLTVVDQSPVRAGGSAPVALQETVALAQAAERFGYDRYWVAEHHNSGTFAGTAPEVLIGQIAARTRSIRVGSAGVMLSHYSALKVAETFRILSAFYPGRIDLGIGRAPGSDQQTAVALVHPRPPAEIGLFPNQVQDLLGFLKDSLPEDHEFAGLRAQPGPLPEGLPEVWLLGSSDYSAQLAAVLGVPFAFADFFGYASEHGPYIADLYRNSFRPSQYLTEPRLNVTFNVLCCDSDEKARYIGSSRRLQIAQSRTGHRRQALIDPEEAHKIMADPAVEQFVSQFTRHVIEGGPERVREAVLEAAARYGTADIGVNTNCFAFEDRLRSYELIADLFKSTGRAAGYGAVGRLTD